MTYSRHRRVTVEELQDHPLACFIAKNTPRDDDERRNHRHSRVTVEELQDHPLACFIAKNTPRDDDDERRYNNSSSSCSMMTYDASVASLDFQDIRIHHDELPVMIESSTTTMSSSYYNSSTSSGISTVSSSSKYTTVQNDLRWGCDRKLAQRFCVVDTRYDSGEEEAEDFCFEIQSSFEDEAPEEIQRKNQIKFYDSKSGKALFLVPAESVHRTFDDFLQESLEQGHLCFRDYEVNWDRVRCTQSGELFSTDGTRLGFYSPDVTGNRYLVNLLAIAGRPVRKKKRQSRRRSLTMTIATSPQKAVKNGKKALRKMIHGLEHEALPISKIDGRR